MKLHLVGPRRAIALICAAQAIVPVCRRSVCVAVCLAACTAWAAAPVRAVSVSGRSLCAWLTCMACEIVSVRRPGVKGFTPLCLTWAIFDGDRLTYLCSRFHQRCEPTR